MAAYLFASLGGGKALHRDLAHPAGRGTRRAELTMVRDGLSHTILGRNNFYLSAQRTIARNIGYSQRDRPICSGLTGVREAYKHLKHATRSFLLGWCNYVNDESEQESKMNRVTSEAC